jgi:hypothetical protein
MIPEKPAPDVIRGGHRFSDKIMLEKVGDSAWRWTPATSSA